MRRREFLIALGAASAWSKAAHAQQDGSIARIGVIGSRREGPAMAPAYAAFTDELRKLGFAEGRNLAIEYRRVEDACRALLPVSMSWPHGRRTSYSPTGLN